MCTVLAPPPLAPAWPWQAPGNWLAFAVALVLVAVGCAVGIVGVRRQTDARRRRIGWVLLLAMTLCLIIGLFLILIVVYPAIDALNSWESQQDQAVRAQGCSAAAWLSLDHLALRTIQNVHYAGGGLTYLGFLLFTLLGWQYPLKAVRPGSL